MDRLPLCCYTRTGECARAHPRSSNRGHASAGAEPRTCTHTRAFMHTCAHARTLGASLRFAQPVDGDAKPTLNPGRMSSSWTEGESGNAGTGGADDASEQSDGQDAGAGCRGIHTHAMRMSTLARARALAHAHTSGEQLFFAQEAMLRANFRAPTRRQIPPRLTNHEIVRARLQQTSCGDMDSGLRRVS